MWVTAGCRFAQYLVQIVRGPDYDTNGGGSANRQSATYSGTRWRALANMTAAFARSRSEQRPTAVLLTHALI